MNRYAMILSALALAACTDTGGGDSDSDTADEVGTYDGERLIQVVRANCIDGTPDRWTFEFITDGLAGGIDIDAIETGSVAPRWTEAHALDLTNHNPHWDAEGSPTGATTRAEAAAMDPLPDANDDNRPDWPAGNTAIDFDTQDDPDADGLADSWDHWYIELDTVTTQGAVVSSGEPQTSLWDCSRNDHTGGASGSLAFKATMYDPGAPASSVDCVIWGFQSSTSEAFQGDMDDEGDACVCIDPDAGDCAD